MRKVQIPVAISSDLCIRLTSNLTSSCGKQQRLRGWSRMVVKQFQDWGQPLFWKSIYCHISVKNHPILMKFCTQQQILNWMNVTWSKIKIVALDRHRVRQNVFLVWFHFSVFIFQFIFLTPCVSPRLPSPLPPPPPPPSSSSSSS